MTPHPSLTDKSKIVGHGRALADFDLEIEKYVSQFEAMRLRGNRARISEFAPSTNHPRYHEILRELIRADMEFAFESGKTPTADAYLEEFESLKRDSSHVEWIRFEESRLRESHGLKSSERSSVSLGEAAGFGRTMSSPLSTRIVRNGYPEAPLDRSPQVGESIAGFDIGAEIGKGAFSEVFLARERGLSGREVVIKVSSQFQGEAGLLARLQHKNIVPIYSQREHGARHVLVMPYLGATTLADLSRELTSLRDTVAVKEGSLGTKIPLQAEGDGPQPKGNVRPSFGESIISTIEMRSNLTLAQQKSNARDGETKGDAAPSENRHAPVTNAPSLLERVRKMGRVEWALWMASEIADGLEHAHQRGILHRDVKPANILVSEDGTPMLLDFNLSKDTHDPSRGVVGGTLHYMSPEQLSTLLHEDEKLDGRSDVYSLGLILYEWIFERSPFPHDGGANDDAIRARQSKRKGELETNVNWNEGITPGVVGMVRKALACEPEQRYASAAQLRDDLLRHLENRPLAHVANRSLRERIRKWNARHPRFSAGVIASALALCVCMGMIAWTWSKESQYRIAQAETRLEQAQKAESHARARIGTQIMSISDIESSLKQTEELVRPNEVRLAMAALSREKSERFERSIAMLRQIRTLLLVELAKRSVDENESRKRLLAATEEDRLADADASRLGLSYTRFAPLIEAALASPKPSLADQVRLAEETHRKSAVFSNPQIALATFEANRSIESSNPDYWISLAYLHHANGDRDAALFDARMAAKLNPTLPTAPYLIGAILLGNGAFSEAERSFTEVISLTREFPEARLYRAMARISQRNWQDAEADLRSIESQASAFPIWYFFREQVALAQGATLEAQPLRKLGLEATPVDAYGYKMRGEAWLRENPPNTQAAFEDFAESIRLDPDIPETYENLAYVQSECFGKRDEAIASLTTLVSRFPKFARGWSSRAVLHARQGNIEQARTDANQAMKLPRDAMVAYQVASAYAVLGQTEDFEHAIGFLRKTVREDASLSALMPADPDLEKLRNRNDFQKLMSAAAELQR